MTKKRTHSAFKLFFSAVILAIVWYTTSSDFDPALVLRDADPIPLAGALLVFVAGQLFAACRLRIVLGAMGRHMNWLTVCRAHFMGIWFNQALPTAVGGDVAKVLTLRRGGDTIRFTRSVVLARVLGLAALFVSSILALPSLRGGVTDSRPFYLIAALAAGGLLGLVIGCLLEPNRGLRRRAPGALRQIALLFGDLRRLLSQRSRFAILWTSALVVISVCLCFQLLGQAFHQEEGLPMYFLAVPPIILSMHIPISYGGWGIREAGAVALLPLVGVPREVALPVSISYGLVMAATGLIGLALWHWSPKTGTTAPKVTIDAASV